MNAEQNAVHSADVECAKRAIRSKWTRSERVVRHDAAVRKQRMLLWLVTMRGVRAGAARQLRHLHTAS